MIGLGKRIKSLRKSRKLTLVEVAQKTGIDQATLSRIENGKMTGTLDSHMKLANCLGIHLPELYEDTLNITLEAKDKAIKQKLETFSHSSGAVAELLTSGILQKKMMPVLLKIKSHGNTVNEEYMAGSEKFIYVLKGSIDLHVGNEKKVLNTGESLYFNASLPHHFKNTSKSECHCLSIVTPSSY
jgi:transcriptional regulator with XRE-family HTH domain